MADIHANTNLSSSKDTKSVDIPKDIHIQLVEVPPALSSSSSKSSNVGVGSSSALIHKDDDDDEVAPIVQLINDGNFDAAGTMLLQMVNNHPSLVTTNSSSFTTVSTSSGRDRGQSTHSSIIIEDEIIRLSRAIFGQLSSYQRMDYFNILDSSIKYQTFQFLRPSEQGLVIDEMKIDDAEQCINMVPFDQRLDTLQRLNYGALEKISHMLTPAEKESCDIMRSYAANSVARSMSSLANTGMILRHTLKIREAVEYYNTNNKHSLFPLSPTAGTTGTTPLLPTASATEVQTTPGPNPTVVVSTSSLYINHQKTNGIILIRDTNNHLLGYTNFQKLLQGYMKEQEDEKLFLQRKDESTVVVTDPHATTEEETNQGGNPSSSSSSPSSSLFLSSTSSNDTLTVPKSSFIYATMESICEPVPFLLKTNDDIDEAIRLFSTQDIFILPVVSSEDSTLQGILRSKDVIQAVNSKLQSALAAAAADTGITSYSKSSVWLLVRKRIFWLLVLAMINFGVSAIVGQFEEVLAQNLVLAGFIPLLAGLGGNIGAQSSALMISAVSSRDISPRGDWRRVLVKETKVGFILCLLLGAIVAVMGYIRGKTGEIALVIGASMGVVSIVSNILGTVLPFISITLGGDPAVSSSPLITTVIDVLGITIYLAFAMAILGLH